MHACLYSSQSSYLSLSTIRLPCNLKCTAVTIRQQLLTSCMHLVVISQMSIAALWISFWPADLTVEHGGCYSWVNLTSNLYYSTHVWHTILSTGPYTLQHAKMFILFWWLWSSQFDSFVPYDVLAWRCTYVHAARVHEPLRWVGRVPMGQKSFLTYHP